MFETFPQPVLAPGADSSAALRGRRRWRGGAPAALGIIALVFGSALASAAPPPEGFADLVD